MDVFPHISTCFLFFAKYTTQRAAKMTTKALKSQRLELTVTLDDTVHILNTFDYTMT
jgi:hypothetical protein